MIKGVVCGGLLALGVALFWQGASCYATALQIQPLQYHSTLKSGERQRGFVDIGNPTTQTEAIDLSVQAFRQVDDKGGLQFYDDDQVQSGIKLDLTSVELRPGEALRLYFIADGSQLPSGDVFAAIFATVKPPLLGGTSVQTVRVGTLLSLVNGTPGARRATIRSMDVSFWQFDETIQGKYVIHNDAASGTANGFYPDVTVSMDPLPLNETVHGSLIMADRSRQDSFSVTTARLGFYRLSVRYGDSVRSRWVFVVSGWWSWACIGLLLALLVIGGGAMWWRRGRHIAFRLRKE